MKNKTWEEKFDTWYDRAVPRGPVPELQKAYNAGRKHQREALKVEWDKPETNWKTESKSWEELAGKWKKMHRDSYAKYEDALKGLAFWKETADDCRLEYTKQKKINDALGAINGKLEAKRDVLKKEKSEMRARYVGEISKLEYDMHLARNYITDLEEKYNRRPWWKFWG
jgi:hypothetical protein